MTSTGFLTGVNLEVINSERPDRQCTTNLNVPMTRYRVTRLVVNDFKWQYNYVKAIKYLLNCYQRLGKFNAIMCVKISQPFVTYLLDLYEPT